jgi:transposase-like protein
MIGTAWQRCRAHFLPKLLVRVARANAEMVAAAIRTVFLPARSQRRGERFDRITAALGGQFPDVVARLADARDDPLACSAFALECWRKLWSA